MFARILSALLVGVIGLLLATAPGCSRGPEPRPSRLVVLGIDGLDFRLLVAMIRQGKLPNFADLLERGAAGRILAAQIGLPAISPQIWTSYVTGHWPQDHGIMGFARPLSPAERTGEQQFALLSSRDRVLPALWEIASQSQRSVGVVNWWFTHPIDPVLGFMISDRFFESGAEQLANYFDSRLDPRETPPVYPPELAATIEALGVSEPRTPLTAEQAEVADRSVLRLAKAAAAHKAVDILLVYTRGLDQLQHLTWLTHEPFPDQHFPRDEVETYMVRWDTLLAEFLATHVGPADHFALLSDHGFERAPRGSRPPGQHTTYASVDAATLILTGPRIRPGAHLPPSTAFDVLPTLLELAGIAASTDMPGKVIRDALQDPEEALLERREAYDRFEVGSGEADASTGNEQERIERLKALGYLR